MSGEPQLERSVLEGKERDKLQAIADALGLKTSARAKKTDLIDGILRATGVEVAPAAEAEAPKPKRAPRRRATEAAANGAAGPGAREAVAEPGPPATVAPEPTTEPAPPPVPAPPVAEGGEPDAPPAPVPPVPVGTEERPPPGPSGPPEQRQEPVRSYPQPTGPPGPGNAATPPPAGQGQAPPTNQPQHNQGQPGQPAPAEGGEVRRNRRRRGRDRDRVGAGYDQQAQQADQAYTGDPLPCDGLLDLRPEGFGFLRTSGYLTGPDDVYVSMSQVRRFALRAGDRIKGASRPPTTQERFGALLRIDAVGDQSPDEARHRPRFDDLTPVFPGERLTLEVGDQADQAGSAEPASAIGRIIDLMAPVGKGQRGMILTAPRSGTTTLLRHLATAVEANHPDVDLMVLLVDERPEEVADMRRHVKGEVIGSTFDRPAEEHAHVAELAIDVAKRRVELGRDVVVVFDGLTRLARAHNLMAPATGRVLPGGVDAGALHPPKRLFAAARNVEGGGSLTILATATVDAGSAADTVIFEDLRGAANMELRLDRRLADQRMYPAIDVTASSTAHEELLLSEEELGQVWDLRRSLAALASDGSGAEAHDMLLERLRSSRTNAELLAGLTRPA